MANCNFEFSIGGLNSEQRIITATGEYTLSGTVSLPLIQSDVGWSVSQPSTPLGAVSSVVVTIKQNGTTVLTTAPGQNAWDFLLACTAGDVILTSVSSSAPIDTIPNTIRTTVTIA
jgi:hypothetical protein